MSVVKILYTIFGEFIFKEDITMKRNNITAQAMPLVGKKLRDIASAINAGNLSVLEKINMHSNVVTMKYIEDDTQEIRNVNVIEIGFPVQLCVNFYM